MILMCRLIILDIPLDFLRGGLDEFRIAQYKILHCFIRDKLLVNRLDFSSDHGFRRICL